jgi:hypothetical protein
MENKKKILKVYLTETLNIIKKETGDVGQSLLSLIMGLFMLVQIIVGLLICILLLVCIWFCIMSIMASIISTVNILFKTPIPPLCISNQNQNQDNDIICFVINERLGLQILPIYIIFGIIMFETHKDYTYSIYLEDQKEKRKKEEKDREKKIKYMIFFSFIFDIFIISYWPSYSNYKEKSNKQFMYLLYFSFAIIPISFKLCMFCNYIYSMILEIREKSKETIAKIECI